MSDTLIKVAGVSKKFCRDLRQSLWYGLKDIGNELSGKRHGGNGELRPGEFWAIKDVSFELKRGECLGLIGRNGAGKTTLLRMLNGLIKPDQGRIEIRGRVGALIALGAGFNPILTGRENIYVNASVLGLSRREIDLKIDSIIDFAEIGDFIDAPVQSYSSGMQVRLGFSVASALEPDVLLLDEILAVGDAAFRGKCFKRIGEVFQRAAVIFVSHSEAQVNRICNSAIMLEAGHMRFCGATANTLRYYRDSQPAAAQQAYVVTDSRVAAIKLLHMPDRLGWGEVLDFEVEIDLLDDVDMGLILVHFSLDNEFKTNAEVQLQPSDILRAGRGSHVLRSSVGPIHLAHGRYQVSFSIFDATGKQTVAQVFDIASIEILGPVGSGPTHLVPMTFHVKCIDPQVAE
jgi:lipopolysaccharide transport system ATP-binding protein